MKCKASVSGQLGNIVRETLTFWTEEASWDRRSRARGDQGEGSGRDRDDSPANKLRAPLYDPLQSVLEGEPGNYPLPGSRGACRDLIAIRATAAPWVGGVVRAKTAVVVDVFVAACGAGQEMRFRANFDAVRPGNMGDRGGERPPIARFVVGAAYGRIDAIPCPHRVEHELRRGPVAAASRPRRCGRNARGTTHKHAAAQLRL